MSVIFFNEHTNYVNSWMNWWMNEWMDGEMDDEWTDDEWIGDHLSIYSSVEGSCTKWLFLRNVTKNRCVIIFIII